MTSRNGPAWEEKRAIVLIRDGWTCRLCGLRDTTGAGLDCDPVVPFGRGGTEELSNLQTLCQTCMDFKHHCASGEVLQRVLGRSA